MMVSNPLNQTRRSSPLLKSNKDPEHRRTVAWGIRYARLVLEKPVAVVYNKVTIWDHDVAFSMQAWIAQNAALYDFCRNLLLKAAASIAHHEHLATWRGAACA